jgi:copper homeostasis protein
MVGTLNSQILVEAIACSADDARTATLAGAGRLEVCSAIAVGGLTPSVGTVAAIRKATGLPLMVMIRPRGSGFCYSTGEFDAMEREIEPLLAAGADGFVVGILNEDGTIDASRCRKLFERAPHVPFVCHRAFDATPDPFAAMETLIEIGFRRILTSGQAPTALEGTDVIHALVERAAGRIEILPGSGVRPGNAPHIVERTGVTQIHLGPFHDVSDRSIEGRKAAAEYGLTYGVADGESISAVVASVGGKKS